MAQKKIRNVIIMRKLEIIANNCCVKQRGASNRVKQRGKNSNCLGLEEKSIRMEIRALEKLPWWPDHKIDKLFYHSLQCNSASGL